MRQNYSFSKNSNALLEPCEGKLSCTVLRGESPSNGADLLDKLDKILYNLLSNASKYNRAGGLVSVELSENEDRTARLVVKDNGPGISAEAQKNLFKRLF